MKARHSDSLILAWRVAEYEARALKATTIEPTHLLLGLCKMVDLDLPALVAKTAPDRDELLEEVLREVRRLRSVFKAASLDAKAFRRALRQACLPPRGVGLVTEQLRRSKEAKEVFLDAEHFAEMANTAVYPAHLLCAVLLAKDESRDNVMNNLGVDKKRLRQVAKQEIVFRQSAVDAPSETRRSNLN